MMLRKNNLLIFFKCNHSVFKVLHRTFKYERPEPVTGCTLAIKHFDDFYNVIFKDKWPSVRLGLFSPQKKVAVINTYGDTDKVKNHLESLGCFNLKSFLEVQKNISEDQKELGDLSNKNIEPLENLLNQKKEEEKNKEMNIFYSENKRDGVKAWFENNDQNFKQNHDEFINDPEEVTTSLAFDLSKAQIDKNRLIIPNSKTHNVYLYEFVPATKLRGLNEYISESEYYKFYEKKSLIKINIEKESKFDFPEDLLTFTFDRGEATNFPDPKKCVNGLYDFLLMDGANLLSVLCLGIEKNDAILSMCFKNETIPYCILQMLNTKIVVCNNQSQLGELVNEYFSTFLKKRVVITDVDLDDPSNQNLYDKILIDVDCTDDRASIFDVENNYFSSKNFKKRFKLPEKQSEELEKVLKIVKPGGTVLYTTTTMSPIQNDGVVYSALERVFHKYKMEFTVKDLLPAIQHTSFFFNINNYLGLKYGTLVVPFLPTNFGPRYISKIVKKS